MPRRAETDPAGDRATCRAPACGGGRAMRDTGAIFFDFTLPNATTWAVLSALLTIALFFKFNRILSVRNWDLVSLFLLVPGLLLLQEGRALWYGYLWLMAGGVYFFLRCLLDLAL